MAIDVSNVLIKRFCPLKRYMAFEIEIGSVNSITQ